MEMQFLKDNDLFNCIPRRLIEEGRRLVSQFWVILHRGGLVGRRGKGRREEEKTGGATFWQLYPPSCHGGNQHIGEGEKLIWKALLSEESRKTDKKKKIQ